MGSKLLHKLKKKTRGFYLSFFFLLSITALSPPPINSQMLRSYGTKRSWLVSIEKTA